MPASDVCLCSVPSGKATYNILNNDAISMFAQGMRREKIYRLLISPLVLAHHMSYTHSFELLIQSYCTSTITALSILLIAFAFHVSPEKLGKFIHFECRNAHSAFNKLERR